MLVSASIDTQAVLRRRPRGRRRRGPRVRRRRPRLAPAGACWSGSAELAGRRPAADRSVGHRRQPGGAARLAAGLRPPAVTAPWSHPQRPPSRRRRGRSSTTSAPSSNAATVIAALHRGEKRLVFCDSRATRRGARRCAAATGRRRPSSRTPRCPLDERRRAEEAFAEARDCVIVATSTLELGIDVGDLDRVIQIDAPRTVASFLQRLGRTGRRPGSRPQLPVPRAGPRSVAARRRAAAALVAGLGRTGGAAAVPATHRRAATARPVLCRRTPSAAGPGPSGGTGWRPWRRTVPRSCSTSSTTGSSRPTATSRSSDPRPRGGSGAGTSPS